MNGTATEILPTSTPAQFAEAVRQAVTLLRAGEVVALPTETVYGLAANAFNAVAVAKIFEVKGRPAHNPVICHVASNELVQQCVARWPTMAEQLARAFWPGPLTLVVPRSTAVPDIVTAGGDTVGIRWPAHPETQFVWQTDLATVASYLDSARNGPTDIAVAGLSNETMDDASLGLLARRRDLSVRWFDSRSALVFPSGGGRLFIPQVVPLDSLLRQTLTTLDAQQHADASGRFEWFDLTAVGPTNLQAVASTPSGVPIPLPRSLDNGMTLMGFQMLGSPLPVKPGDYLAVQTYWQAGALPLPPLKAFVHLIDARGQLVAQSDGLSAPTQFLRNGDVIVQLHRLPIPPGAATGAYRLILGLYNSQTGVRAQFLDATGRPMADYLWLPEIEVQP